jgi:hypothetical protein
LLQVHAALVTALVDPDSSVSPALVDDILSGDPDRPWV